MFKSLNKKAPVLIIIGIIILIGIMVVGNVYYFLNTNAGSANKDFIERLLKNLQDDGCFSGDNNFVGLYVSDKGISEGGYLTFCDYRYNYPLPENELRITGHIKGGSFSGKSKIDGNILMVEIQGNFVMKITFLDERIIVEEIVGLVPNNSYTGIYIKQ